SLPSSVSSALSTSGKREDPTDRKQLPKRSKTVESRKSAAKKSEDMQPPNKKKKTKKQEAKEATERRHQLSLRINLQLSKRTNFMLTRKISTDLFTLT
ncbi:hypothetical protein GN958_ATG21213, partial [Phytophthora infestans]